MIKGIDYFRGFLLRFSIIICIIQSNKTREKMKRITKLVLVALLAVTSVDAKEVFGLQKQYLENAKKAKVKVSAYDLDNAIISTVNVFQKKGGAYRSAKPTEKENTKGFLKVQLKEAIASYQIDVKVDIGNACRMYTVTAPLTIVLKSSSGNDLSINLEEGRAWVNDSSLDKISLCEKINTISVASIEDEIVVSINGKDKLLIEDETFTDLKEVSILLTTVSVNSRKYVDELYDLSISGK